MDATIVSVEDVYAALDYLHYEANPSWSDENREIAKMEMLTAFKLQRKDLVFEGRDGTNSRTIPVTWYKKWGLEARPTCKIISCSGKRSDLIAPGEWLAITPCRAFRNGKVFERTFFDAYRFVMLMASIRFGTSSGSA